MLRTNWNAEDGTVAPNQGAWDNGVLMDPGRDSYKAEMVAQTQRRVDNIPHFQGVVVDRSDYARYYNLEHDDGVTLTTAPNTTQAWSLKRSYLEVIGGIRGVLGTDKVMLMNSLGYSSISFMKDIDGTFSEGKAFNAVGLLGAGGMVNIMWTSNAGECCGTEAAADVYFQRRLYMGVYPMAPIPAADHCISYDPVTAGYYANYGGLFAALQTKRFNFAPHAAKVVGGSGVVNAFVLANKTLVYPVGLATTSSVTLELRSVPTAVAGWEATFPGAAAGRWSKLPNATQTTVGVAKVKVWHVNVAFPDTKAHHAAIVRSVPAVV